MTLNPLLENQNLPPFSIIKAQHAEPAIDQILSESLAQVKQLLNANTDYTWANLIEPLELIDERISRIWSPIGHLNSVVNSEELRSAYNACLPKLSAYSTEMGQNEKLFQAFLAVEASDAYKSYDHAQQKIIQNAIRDFRLSGVELPSDKKNRYKEIMQELANLSSKFDENLLDATHAWTQLITDKTELSGLPDSAINLAKQTAEREKQQGWLFSLEFPSYYPVMCYADNRALREKMYAAYVTRASDVGPGEGKWDNTENMEKILALRHEAAQLLGFKNYASKSLATKMANSTEQVLTFLSDLAEKSIDIARHELDELQAFAYQEYQVEALEAWDLPYYSEKLRQHKYAVTQEELKPYFPEDRVLKGMFYVVKNLYGLDIIELTGIDTWHPDVRFFSIKDQNGILRGQFYLDLYVRQNKRGGAWMDECITRMEIDSSKSGDKIQIPVAFLTCNFSPKIGADPALFTHDEVITLFHEFGHGLHHMLTQVKYPSVSGISGVPWDAVELPSQFMENWCWQKEALDHISGHYQSNKPLPDDLFEKMMAAKNFQSGMQMLRQLEFAIFDFRLHAEYDPAKGAKIYDLLAQVRTQVSVLTPPAFNRFPHSFAHIFAGGYAAGYYSYKWAEVLSADAFAKFEENGIFDQQTGLAFLNSILEQGGAKEPMDLFIAFRGREPQIDALLRHSGILATEEAAL